jgi:hypothetical protein
VVKIRFLESEDIIVVMEICVEEVLDGGYRLPDVLLPDPQSRLCGLAVVSHS